MCCTYTYHPRLQVLITPMVVGACASLKKVPTIMLCCAIVTNAYLHDDTSVLLSFYDMASSKF